MKKQLDLIFEELDSIKDLNPADQDLLTKAFAITKNSYAPYSKFKVGAIAKLDNGEIVSGCNLENSSYGVTICAERVLLGNVLANHPNQKIVTLAVSYDDGMSDHPISPCGICRQALFEHESINQTPIRLILGGKSGKVIVIESVSYILPFGFTLHTLRL